MQRSPVSAGISPSPRGAALLQTRTRHRIDIPGLRAGMTELSEDAQAFAGLTEQALLSERRTEATRCRRR